MRITVSKNLKRFNYLISEINAVYHEAAVKLRLSDSALQILYSVCSSGDVCLIRDICNLSGMRKQTVNSALRNLEKDGILYLKPHNSKQKAVYLTDFGKQLAQNTVMHIIKIENDIFNSWHKSEQEQYINLTQKYLVSFADKINKLETRGE